MQSVDARFLDPLKSRLSGEIQIRTQKTTIRARPMCDRKPAQADDMSENTVKIPFAERRGQLVHVSTVPRGLKCGCVCPVCKETVVARKGEVMSHHFAHYRRGTCSPETVLHYLGKRLLHDRIVRHLAEGKKLPLRWNCPYCPDTHRGDLLKLARQVEMEVQLEGCRPDLVLWDGDEEPVAVLEMVVTHQPDENVLEYCEKRGVTLLQFNLRNVRDLLALEYEQPLRPSHVTLCLRPQCEDCGKPLSPAFLHVLDVSCWRCGFPMRVAFVRADNRTAGPEVFGERQTDLARRQGVLLRENYSLSSRKRYVANTCPTCGAFVGVPYLLRYAHKAPDTAGKRAGYVCLNCRPE